MPHPKNQEPVGKSGHEATPLELFFDLVFVFAVFQLSHHLFAHPTLRGAAETLVLLMAVFTVWAHTSWSATIIPADRPRTLWMVLPVMLLGLFMNAALPKAFAGSAWLFVIPLLAINLGRTVWTILTARRARLDLFSKHYIRVLIWFVIVTPLWIAGALAGPEARLAWWAGAAGVEVVSTWFGHPVPGARLDTRDVPFDAGHILERCSLFLLVALGETILTTGLAVSEAPPNAMTILTGSFALAGTMALWVLGFGRSIKLTMSFMGSTADPLYSARHALNGLMFMVAGLIGIAVANEMVVAHPEADTSPTLSLLMAGGSAVFLLSQAWYSWALPGVLSWLHLGGAAALATAGFAALLLPAYATIVVLNTLLILLAAMDARSIGYRPAKSG